jgi:CheY-like chemotaxis protein
VANSILVVEDDQPVQTFLERALRLHGYSVECASDGDEAMAQVEKLAGHLSLVLLDLRMPRKNGIEILREIRQMDKDLRPPCCSSFYFGLVLSGVSGILPVVAGVAGVQRVLQWGLQRMFQPLRPHLCACWFDSSLHCCGQITTCLLAG